MKSKIIAFGLALAAIPGFAQQHSHNYNVSAFSNFHKLRSSEKSNPLAVQNALQQQLPGWSATVDKLNGSLRDAFGPAAQIPGNTLEAKAQYCLDNKLRGTQVIANSWQQTRHSSSPDHSYIGFEQSFGGRKVAFARATFTFTTDGKLVRMQVKDYGQPVAGVAPTLSQADLLVVAAQGLEGAVLSETTIDNDWIWFPVPSANGYELRPAWGFSVKGEGKNLPLDLRGYIDGITGKMLYRQNKVKETVTQTVNGSVFVQNPLLPASVEPLANLAMTINSTTYYTDDNGVFSDAVLSAPISATMPLQGKWSRVRTGTANGVTPSFTNSIATTGSIYTYPNIAPASDKHVNAYYHVNKVHDFMKYYFPAFTGMDFVLPTVVDMTTGSCNAFYNGNSINFYAENLANGCNSFALCGDIIYHEYGHGISDKFYQDQVGNGMENGALNEGNSDIWGIGITNDPVLGKGSMTTGGIIRRYDQAPKVYPQDIEGEVHADGEIIAGAWWDVALNIGATDTMSQLFTKTYFATPDGPDGTEGEVYHDVLISALIADDNDNDLSNGTPHFLAIVKAFARHGIYLLGDATVNHTEIAHQPGNAAITINASLNVSMPVYLGDVKLFYRNRLSGITPYDSVMMTANPPASLNFTAQLPAQAAGSIMDYYFTVADSFGNLNTYAPTGFSPLLTTLININSTIPFQFGVGLTNTYTQDFETPLDVTSANPWKIQLATDDAQKGKWIQAVPVASFVNSASGQLPVQTGADHTTGTGQCLVTGNASSPANQPGIEDIDNGTTTVLTPVFDISNYAQPAVEYHRWFSNDRGNNPGNDLWEVQIRDGADPTWRYVDRTYKSDYNWRRRIFNAKEYVPGATSFQMQFIASDKVVTTLFQNGQSTVEAAVDDIFIYDKTPLSGVNNTNASRASIYPNPANQAVNIRLAQPASGFIGVYDVTGKELSRVNMSAGQTVYSISTAGLATGTYMVMVQTDRSIQTQKVSVVH